MRGSHQILTCIVQEISQILERDLMTRVLMLRKEQDLKVRS